MSFGDAMLRDGLDMGHESPHRSDIEEQLSQDHDNCDPSPSLVRRNTVVLGAEADVCFPTGLSEIAEDELHTQDDPDRSRRRRRRGRWPDLSILEDWTHFEKEGRTDVQRVKKVTEPQLVNGRLRPTHKGWYRTEEDAPYRFTYFNEEFQSTIHSQTISELVQPGASFRELFIPDRRILSDDEDDEEEGEVDEPCLHAPPSLYGEPRLASRQPSLATTQETLGSKTREGTLSPVRDKDGYSSRAPSDQSTPTGLKSPPLAPEISEPKPKVKTPKYGDRPVWWLDILSPTEAEMKVLSKAFGIHPLSAEDIMVQEAREKVELFRNYYFVSYRSFDQDINSENFLEPVNMYVVVFREGVLSFHFSMTPHPANVRRRIRQLQDYLIVNSDWISYAIIDDITDVFVPLIQNIEEEVDDIDDAILRLHSSSDKRTSISGNEKAFDEVTTAESGGDMLRRVGDCRKRVMALYRLLGTKADVIKGFAKRCNERWEVAPRSDIGLYLGDIQDHIVTMTSNLSHYEK
jgi:magnesium transporter